MKLIFITLLSLVSSAITAQQNHFIYLQTDNRQPFYVKLDKKIWSSSASGYLIIPKLQEGDHHLNIGFPKDEWPEQKLTCSINQSDQGYLLKNFGEKGWGLFNLQSMELVMANTNPWVDTSRLNDKKEDAFSTLLANVVNDPGLRVIPEDTVAVKTDTPEVRTKPLDVAVVKKKVRSDLKNSAKPVFVNKKTRISKLLDKKNKDSLNLVYVDLVRGNADTINVVIPNEKPVKLVQPEKKLKTPPADLVKSKLKPVRKKPVAKTEIVKTETKIIDKAIDTANITHPETKTDVAKVDIITTENKELKKDSTVFIPTETKPEEPRVDSVIADTRKMKTDSINVVSTEKKAEVVIEIPKVDTAKTTDLVIQANSKSDSINNIIVANTDSVTKPVEIMVKEKPREIIPEKTVTNAPAIHYACKYVADGDEFMNLRKKMANGRSDNEMLYYAHKLFLKRCVTTKQIERLSLLFSNDMAKYNLFDDAYHYVVDLENFTSLETQLTDAYYIKRFKAMILQ